MHDGGREMNKEEFISYNQARYNNVKIFGESYVNKMIDEEFAIASEVERKMLALDARYTRPIPGDAVEFAASEYEVYEHGIIGEQWGHGMLHCCGNGSSHTTGDGRHSVSGGSWKAFHYSKLELIGEEKMIFWTWGRNGSGANEGIYFPVTVKKWRVQHEEEKAFSKVYFKNENGKYRVFIEAKGTIYSFQSFNSIKAFTAWCNYVGYSYKRTGSYLYGCIGDFNLKRLYCPKEELLPEGVKPIKLLYNARIIEGYVYNDGKTIFHIIPTWVQQTIPAWDSSDEERELELYRKYADNPMGV